ncbi:MAG: YggS family pyridoxal phosphate-dependent enzyme [Anaerolineae bacterium]|nr:YggS family pyridoxal phosphate-dependent enzyme [Anaerolineae bacterium]
MSDYAVRVCQNLQTVRARIAEAALRAGRAPETVRLVAVSKTHPAEAVLAALSCGQRDFGENRPEEGAQKIPEVAALSAERPIWHSIGPIQSRKARMVILHFDMVHALDRVSIAEKLSRLATEVGRELPVLLECNVSGEVSKYGYQLAGWEHAPDLLTAFFDQVRVVAALPGLRLKGLMTMAPIVEDPDQARPVFISLRALRDALAEQFPQITWQHLSMGMTDDFEVAVEEGATLVRIGRAIFGARE